MIDQSMLQERLSRVSLMMRNVDHLLEMGLIRNFHDEEECGKTAGAVTPDGKYGVLLTESQWLEIVAKLGGHGKKGKKQAASAGKQTREISRENIIWKQMHQ